MSELLIGPILSSLAAAAFSIAHDYHLIPSVRIASCSPYSFSSSFACRNVQTLRTVQPASLKCTVNEDTVRGEPSGLDGIVSDVVSIGKLLNC